MHFESFELHYKLCIGIGLFNCKSCYFGEELVMLVWFESAIFPHDIYTQSYLTTNSKLKADFYCCKFLNLQ